MKLHYSEILLFALLLTILVHNKNKPYITPHHKTTTKSRVLRECDTQSSNYNNDADMKSVKVIFDRQTSQRFEEYEERMKEKRQKHKEERDKNIQKIIDKDKMDKSLAEKIEKGCLRCGCGLGGVAASVGLFGGLGTYGWKISATTAAAKAAGAKEGMKILISKLKDELILKELYHDSLVKAITTKNYLNEALIFERVKHEYGLCFSRESVCGNDLMLNHYNSGVKAKGLETAVQDAEKIVREAVKKASEETFKVTATKMETPEANELADIVATSYNSYSAIGYSVLAILIIALVMIIIYLILRYRRKRKMNKKAQYTKLLNQ
ncbi:rifin PIR protein, putative [Plasmodium reichenowi]|uniref:Rifin PIR protein, putative n=1 Tax=Plasmodium reichenowi TaxID=5854 RepID=A0A2P9DTB8_PLARE|nr:rifin PIR protein, putative [Plasmodium reichenowi]